MTVLTDAQIAGYAAGAGFTGDQVAVMTAIALAESGGNTTASNPSGAEGVWQVMWTLHGFTGDPYDPATNAAAAHQVFGQQGYGAWTAHTNGAYLMFMGRAQTAAQAPAASAGSSSTTTPTADSTGLTSAVGTATAGSTWARIGLFILGAVLLFFAVLRLTGADKVIIKGAMTAVKAGAV